MWPFSSGIRDPLKKNLERIWRGKDEQRDDNFIFLIARSNIILFSTSVESA